MTILEKIIEEKRVEVERLLAQNIELRSEAVSRPSLFKTLYEAEHLQVISEIKRASPSKGLIAEGADPVAQAEIYVNAGAAAISVLTDTPFFKGSFDDLAAVANHVDIPLLCKDFIIHQVQIDRAKHAGASVILLIVAALSDQELAELHAYATASGLEVLVEVHDAEELQRALAIDAKLIGVNNRDLRSFTVDLKKTEEIAALFPFDEERVLISESGIWKAGDAQFVSNAGARAVLVGESLMRSGNVNETLRSLQVPLSSFSRKAPSL
jgi:indole-3-glycerol phosphate synthase